MNPYVVGGAVLVLAVGGFTGGWKANDWRRDSQLLAIEKAAQKAGEAATGAAVTAIQGIQVKYVTIKQNAETVTREVPVYRDCIHDPRGLQSINAALSGGEPGRNPAGLPDTSAPD